jgi:type I restriction enzyme S subunit
MAEVITDNLDLWTSALLTKSTAGRGSNGKLEAYGIKKLRELILELAVRGKLVPQDPNDEPASALLPKVLEENARLLKEMNKKPNAVPEITDGEITFQLPQGWEYVRNGSLFSLRKGKKPGNISESAIGLPYLDIEALDRDNVLRFTDDNKCPRATEEDILVVCDGSRSGLVLEGKNGVIGSTLAVIDTPKLIQSFIKLLFMESYERLNSTMKGAAIPHLDTNRLILEVVGLPPLNEQHRIVAKVEELMALCDQLEQQQTDSIAAHQILVETLLGTLTRVESQQEFSAAWARIASHFDTLFTTEASIDQLKQTILQLAVMGKLVPQDPNDEPAEIFYGEKKELPKGYVRSNKQAIKGMNPISVGALPRIPKSWIYRSVDNLYETNHILDYADGNHGSLYPRKEDFGIKGVLFLTAAQITNKGDIDWDDCPRLAHEKAKPLTKGWSKEGDVFFTHNATVGRTAIAESCPEKEFLLGTSVTFYRINEDSIHPRYLYLFFSSPTWYSQAETVMQQTTRNQVSITKQALFFIALPPLPEQKRIVDIVNQLFPLLEQLSNGIKETQITQIHLADAIVEQAVC